MNFSQALPALALVLAACTPGAPAGPSLDVQLAAEDLDAPIDAVPAADGDAIYVLANHEGELAVLALDGGEVTPIATGLGPARSLDISSDGSFLVVADGGIEWIALDGARTRIPGTDDHGARGVDLVRVGSVDLVYFTGVDRETGAAAIYSVDLAGGPIEVVATGFADAQLDALVRGKDGTFYASDLRGRIWRASPSGPPEPILSSIGLGDPAGIALTTDESTLLVSSVSSSGTSQLALLDTRDLFVTIFSDVIGTNTDSGGLRRAESDDTFAWVGIATSGEGLVYRIDM